MCGNKTAKGFPWLKCEKVTVEPLVQAGATWEKPRLGKGQIS